MAHRHEALEPGKTAVVQIIETRDESSHFQLKLNDGLHDSWKFSTKGKTNYEKINKKIKQIKSPS
jgi:hypothetical protein